MVDFSWESKPSQKGADDTYWTLYLSKMIALLGFNFPVSFLGEWKKSQHPSTQESPRYLVYFSRRNQVTF